MQKGQRTFQEIKECIPKDTLEKLFLEEKLSKDLIAEKLNICYSTLTKLLSEYELKRDSKSIACEKSKKTKQQQSLDKILAISKEELESYYIKEDHGYYETVKHFNCKPSFFDKVLAYYNLYKPRKQSAIKALRTKLDIYGADNLNNWQKGWKTREEHFGSVEESYKQGQIKQQNTCLERYGYKSIFASPDIKSHTKKKDTYPNKSFATLLKAYNIPYEQEFVIDTKSYDFKLDNVLIEINPTATHNSTWIPFGDYKGIKKTYHRDKSLLAKQNNYRCIHIWDWDDKDKIINSILYESNIYARKCDVKEITKQDLDRFLNEYHFQGTCKNQTIRFGLYYNNELVQVMTFGKARYNKNYQYELLRLCTKARYRVIGGSEKLFKHFVNIYNPDSIISYCDNSKFNGDVYSRLGMQLKSTGQPVRHWYNPNLKIHIIDSLLLKQGFDRLLGDIFGTFGKNTSNEQLMLDHGFVEIYDCGQSSYIWNKVMLNYR